MGGSFDLMALFYGVACCRHNEWDSSFDTHRQHVHRPGGSGEVDEDIDTLTDGDVATQGHIYLAQPTNLADVLANLRMAGRLKRRDKAEFLVLAREVDKALAHTTGGSIYA
jgi:hypothetical protein